MQHWFYFCLYVTTSCDLKGKFVSELSTAQAMTLITLFKKRGRKVPYSVFMVYFLCFILGESNSFPKSQICWRFYPFLPWKLRIPSIFPNRLMPPLINPGKAQAQTMRKAHVTMCVYTMRFIFASFLPFHMCMCIARNISVVWLNTCHLYAAWGWFLLGLQKPCQLGGCLGCVSMLHSTAEGISTSCPCLNSPQPILMCVGSCSIHIPCIFTFTRCAGINRHQPGANCLLQRPRSCSHGTGCVAAFHQQMQS